MSIFSELHIHGNVQRSRKQMKNTWLWNRVNEPSLSAWVFVAWLHRRYLFTALAIDYYSKTLFSLFLCITFARKFEDCKSNFSSVVSSPSLKSFKSQDSLLISMSFINSCTAVKKYELGRIVSCKKSVLIYSSQSWLMLLFFHILCCHKLDDYDENWHSGRCMLRINV